jgi:hypothetical protein
MEYAMEHGIRGIVPYASIEHHFFRAMQIADADQRVLAYSEPIPDQKNRLYP